MSLHAFTPALLSYTLMQPWYIVPAPRITPPTFADMLMTSGAESRCQSCKCPQMHATHNCALQHKLSGFSVCRCVRPTMRYRTTS